jgi:hypothetical protein
MKFAAALVTLAGVVPAFAANITVVVGADQTGAPALVYNPQVITAVNTLLSCMALMLMQRKVDKVANNSSSYSLSVIS